MANAVNGFAHWLDKNVGYSNGVETLAYMGIADLRTPILFLSAIKCGYKALLLSPRNPLAANLSILRQTECMKICYSPELASLVRSLQEGRRDLLSAEVPTLDDMLLVRSVPYPYECSFDDVARRQILILHSSGSTGLPKPIVMTHGTFATMDNDRNLPRVEGRKKLDFTIWDFPNGGKYYTAFPPFHLAGVVATAIVPIFSEAAAPVLGLATRPATGAMVKAIMDHHRLNSLFVPPSIIEQLLQEPNGLNRLKDLGWLAYTGGPLSPSAGNTVSKVVDVCQYFGITETLPLQQLVPPREDWAYIEWNPCRNIEMQPSDDEAYELVVLSDDTTKQISGLDHNYPGIKEWHTKDLFKVHPTKPNLWRFHGRKDDIIALSNGEKFNPVPIESLLQGHPLLAGALVVGQGRIQAVLLLESQPGLLEGLSLIKDVWPLIEQANRLVPGHGQITRSKVLIASPSKPFQRAGKGTIVRRLTEQAYASEIESLFQGESEDNHEEAPALISTSDIAAIKQFVLSCITSSSPGVEVTYHDDIFVLGVDSLKALTIAAMMKFGLQKHHSKAELAWLSDKILYEYPTVAQLSEEIYKFSTRNTSNHRQTERENPTRTAKMAAVVSRYTQNLPQRPASNPLPSCPTTYCVALTGSTGALGPHLLRVLVDDTTISRIYCLNRSADARQRHHAMSAKRSIPPPDDSKVKYLKTDFSRDSLGLETAVFEEMKSKVNVIVHNAWKVDFKHSLRSYEDIHIRGIRQLVDWSIYSPHCPRIIFVSSASAVGNWVLMHKAQALKPPSIPESFICDYEAAQQMGYGESKHVAERILDVVNKQSGLPVTILRVGQIAGSTLLNDLPWPEQEWIPSLIKTSKSIGSLPRTLVPVDWIPVDKLAVIVDEIMHVDLEAKNAGARVYNLVNPYPATWESLLATLRNHLGLDGKATVVSLTDWIARLNSHDRTDLEELASKPALKLLDLLGEFEAGNAGLVFETTSGVEVSETLRALQSVGPEWMEIWLKQWGF
ncbi:MAG: hypothetical protein Q9166_005222 [cf. Caloplaca sp. 2 TL-2023]